jgi:hypothetical protein
MHFFDITTLPLLDMLHHLYEECFKHTADLFPVLNELCYCNDDSDDRLSRSIREFNFYRTQLTGMANELGMLHLSPEAPRECINYNTPITRCSPLLLLKNTGLKFVARRHRGQPPAYLSRGDPCLPPCYSLQASTDHGPRSIPQYFPLSATFWH